MHSKKELQDMTKSKLIELVLKLDDKAAKLEDALVAAHEKIEELEGEITDKDQTIEELNESKIESKEEKKYSAYGRTGLSKEEYDQLLRDKST